ncbi:hypothetical protein [Caldimonas brevitalea]|uniref:Uncharacterized protein n=1 Tax=Caldimonas brevitalea TaxID=413882 RepID=A0A0G3BLH9_9BURK|nr:hypothetical protein [Caldimonas brevitalea]AKJ28828.1 hypothetical protein AAW51_2137 [Caldimonas brevitalea]
MPKPSLHVISGSPAPDGPHKRAKERRKADARPAELIQCHRCGGREVIEAKVGVLLKDGRPTGGTKALLCACCLLRGERVVLG